MDNIPQSDLPDLASVGRKLDVRAAMPANDPAAAIAAIEVIVDELDDRLNCVRENGEEYDDVARVLDRATELLDKLQKRLAARLELERVRLQQERRYLIVHRRGHLRRGVAVNSHQPRQRGSRPRAAGRPRRSSAKQSSSTARGDPDPEVAPPGVVTLLDASLGVLTELRFRVVNQRTGDSYTGLARFLLDELLDATCDDGRRLDEIFVEDVLPSLLRDAQ